MIQTENFFTEEIEVSKSLLKEAKKLVITCHERPDGDALGSSLALNNYFSKLGIKTTVVVPSVYPNFLKWMPGEQDVIAYDKHKDEADKLISEADLIFCLDFNDLARLGDMRDSAVKSKSKFINIDHHLNPQEFASAAFINTSASSTAELVYEFILAMDGEHLIDYDIAVNLYAGILTDTGSFQFSNTSSKVHEIVAKLVGHGIDPSFVHNEIYNSFSLNRLRFFGYCLTKKMVVIRNKRTAYIAVSADEMKRFAIGVGDTEGLVNYPLKMKNIDVVALFKEQNEKIKISFRSKGENNVNLLARTYFDGGGHKNASGGHSDESLENTTVKFENIINNFSFK
ncbi:MAG: bifunctional oligoribonuclease/PAP phosphatase NrnA [Chitinophagales bacterium]|nr:bifunctional oligoribonuclease/PAP phosphatase NrnA [Chitinophagales bacterium]